MARSPARTQIQRNLKRINELTVERAYIKRTFDQLKKDKNSPDRVVAARGRNELKYALKRYAECKSKIEQLEDTNARLKIAYPHWDQPSSRSRSRSPMYSRSIGPRYRGSRLPSIHYSRPIGPSPRLRSRSRSRSRQHQKLSGWINIPSGSQKLIIRFK